MVEKDDGESSASPPASSTSSSHGSPSGGRRPTSVPVSLRSSTLQSLVRPGISLSGKTGPNRSTTTATAGPGVKSVGLHLAKPKSLFSDVVGKSPSVGALAKAKAFSSKTSFSFAPNVNRARQSRLTVASGQQRSDGLRSAGLSSSTTGGPGGAMSVQDLLVQRLAVRGVSVNPASIGRRPIFEAKVVSPLKSKMAQFELMRRKRRNLKKSRDISELSWPPEDQPEDVTIYTPISLPYVMREDNDEDAAGPSHNKLTDNSGGRKSQRPSVKKIDEANRNAASILFGDQSPSEDDGSSGMGNWMLVQWPSILPALDRSAMERQREEAELELLDDETRATRKQELAAAEYSQDNTTRSHIPKKYIPSTFSELPEGRLGTLLIRRSGRVQLAIGNHLFDVNAGSDCNFSQEAGCLVEENSEFFFLGKCLKRMTVTPNVTLMINQQDKSDATR